MTAVRVAVTAGHIAAAGPPPGPDATTEITDSDPVERAIADVTGQKVICDQDSDTIEIATIGQGQTILIVELPPEQKAWIDSWYAGEPVEPFEFDIQLETWLTDFVRIGLTAKER
jgi:hypothetical protein